MEIKIQIFLLAQVCSSVDFKAAELIPNTNIPNPYYVLLFKQVVDLTLNCLEGEGRVPLLIPPRQSAFAPPHFPMIPCKILLLL